MQLRRISSAFGVIARPALAGALGLLLLAAVTLSSSDTLHRALHQDGFAHSHFCLVCSFSGGQVDAAEIATAAAALVWCLLFRVHFLPSSPFQGFDHRLSPSRGPPEG